jgi:hypothetical protein
LTQCLQAGFLHWAPLPSHPLSLSLPFLLLAPPPCSLTTPPCGASCPGAARFIFGRHSRLRHRSCPNTEHLSHVSCGGSALVLGEADNCSPHFDLWPRSHAHSARELCSSITHSRRCHDHLSHHFHRVLNATLFSQYSCCVFARAPSHRLCSRPLVLFASHPRGGWACVGAWLLKTAASQRSELGSCARVLQNRAHCFGREVSILARGCTQHGKSLGM